MQGNFWCPKQLQYYTGISGNVSSFNWKLDDNRWDHKAGHIEPILEFFHKIWSMLRTWVGLRLDTATPTTFSNHLANLDYRSSWKTSQNIIFFDLKNSLAEAQKSVINNSWLILSSQRMRASGVRLLWNRMGNSKVDLKKREPKSTTIKNEY